MLTYDDCLALCGLTEEEVAAIAEHDHVPYMAAVEIGAYIIAQPDGEYRMRRIVLEDIARAEATGHLEHARELRRLMAHFAHGRIPQTDT